MLAYSNYAYYFCIIKVTHSITVNRYTAMTNEDYMNNELTALAAMTEEEACKVYNVDYKAEAEIYIRDYWMYIA